MHETLILCGGIEPSRRSSATVLELNTNVNAPPSKRVVVKLEKLKRQLLANAEPVLCDALDIAAYVYIADRMTKRGSEQSPRMGADWRRRFRFQIPVRCPRVWQDLNVIECLTNTLTFLSEDEFIFEFKEGLSDVGLEPFLDSMIEALKLSNRTTSSCFPGGSIP